MWAVLDSPTQPKFTMHIDGRGVVHIHPMSTTPDLTINSSSIGLLSNGIDFSADMSEIPNRYIVIEDEHITIATNDDPESIVSTVSRGYFVDNVDTSPTPVNGKTIIEYANDKLHELSIMKDERTYTREYAPNVHLYSLVRASIDGLQGDLRVASQSIDCGNGIKVTERASREIPLW